MTAESSKTSSGPRRVARLVILFVLLVVLPAGSWYYLSGGLNWRKKAVGELRMYAKIPPVMVIPPVGERFNDLESKVCIIYNFGYEPDLNDTTKLVMDTYQNLFTQFGLYSDETVRPDLRFVPLFEGGTAEFRSYYQTLASSDYASWRRSGGIGQWRTILENSYEQFCRDEGIKPAPAYYALTDTSGHIRRFYNAMKPNEVGRMVEHIAILLPRQQQ